MIWPVHKTWTGKATLGCFSLLKPRSWLAPWRSSVGEPIRPQDPWSGWRKMSIMITTRRLPGNKDVFTVGRSRVHLISSKCLGIQPEYVIGCHPVLPIWQMLVRSKCAQLGRFVWELGWIMPVWGVRHSVAALPDDLSSGKEDPRFSSSNRIYET